MGRALRGAISQQERGCGSLCWATPQSNARVRHFGGNANSPQKEIWSGVGDFSTAAAKDRKAHFLPGKSSKPAFPLRLLRATLGRLLANAAPSRVAGGRKRMA